MLKTTTLQHNSGTAKVEMTIKCFKVELAYNSQQKPDSYKHIPGCLNEFALLQKPFPIAGFAGAGPLNLVETNSCSAKGTTLKQAVAFCLLIFLFVEYPYPPCAVCGWWI